MNSKLRYKTIFDTEKVMTSDELQLEEVILSKIKKQIDIKGVLKLYRKIVEDEIKTSIVQELYNLNLKKYPDIWSYKKQIKHFYENVNKL